MADLDWITISLYFFTWPRLFLQSHDADVEFFGLLMLLPSIEQYGIQPVCTESSGCPAKPDTGTPLCVKARMNQLRGDGRRSS